MFKIHASIFQTLCFDLESQYGLKALRMMSVIEKMDMFLYTLALGSSNRKVHERFQHLEETVSRYFNDKVLTTIYLLAVDVIKLKDSEFVNTPHEITINPRYMPHFKVTPIYFLIINYLD